MAIHDNSSAAACAAVCFGAPAEPKPQNQDNMEAGWSEKRGACQNLILFPPSVRKSCAFPVTLSKLNV